LTDFFAGKNTASSQMIMKLLQNNRTNGGQHPESKSCFCKVQASQMIKDFVNSEKQ